MATATLTLSTRDHGRPFRLIDFLAADVEEGHVYELNRGVLDVTKVPGTMHRQVCWNLDRCFARYDLARPGAILCAGGGSEFQLVIPEFASGRNPDAAVILRPEPTTEDRNPRPALAAEVVSRRSVHRDYVLKREEYLAYGLLEYWIVDFWARKLTMLVRVGDAWTEQVLTDGSAAIPSVALPGLVTTVGDLWADLDFYETDDEDEAIGAGA